MPQGGSEYLQCPYNNRALHNIKLTFLDHPSEQTTHQVPGWGKKTPANLN